MTLNPFSKKNHNQFLKKFWQKKYLHIPQAIDDFSGLPSIEEFQKLSQDKRLPSRIIVEKPKLKGEGRWSVFEGPFEKSSFLKLKKERWSLLINDLEKVHPFFQKIKKLVSFIPEWRFDDIMMSYATDQASVGAHLDNYDVFLIQVYGEREWLIEDFPRTDDSFDPRFDLKILPDFAAKKSFILRPGDALYLPPRFAHHGISHGEGMTVSIGFRAPSFRDIALAMMEDLSETLTDDFRFHDKGTFPLSESIDKNAGKICQKNLLPLINNSRAYRLALGKLSTMPLRMTPEVSASQKVHKIETLLKKNVRRNPFVRSSYSYEEDCNDGYFFVQGSSFAAKKSPLLKKLFLLLNNHLQFTPKDFSAYMKNQSTQEILTNLVEYDFFLLH